MIRNIIFDWSGTLVDDLPAVLFASNAVFRSRGVAEFTLDQFRREFCLPFQEFYDRFLPDAPLAELEVCFHAHFREAQHLVTELPYALDFLQFCEARGIQTLVLSSAHQDHYHEQAQRTGFASYLRHPYVQVRDKRAKIQEILREHALRPEETLFVGDMAHDIETAHCGGLYACAVLTGYNHLDQLREAKPHLIVEHLGELRSILEIACLDLQRHLAPERSEEDAKSLTPIATVGALIFNSEDQVLLVRTRKWSDLWGIPGGKIKPGEPSIDALRRELLEETGQTVTDIQMVMVQDCIHPQEFYRPAHFLLLNYTCRANERRAVVLNEESQDYRWSSLQEALNLSLNQPTRILIEIVLAKSPTIPFSSPTGSH